MIRFLNTFAYTGLIRPAPGTWGSLAAVLAGWALCRFAGAPALAIATALAILIGFRTIAIELADQPGADPGHIVIDEVAGQWLALLFPAAAFWARGWSDWLPWPAPLAAFLFFRLFDIWKPWLVGRADRRGDAAGVMLDDLWAGLFAGIATLIAAAAWHIPMALMAGQP